jgi:cell wall-associated protease
MKKYLSTIILMLFLVSCGLKKTNLQGIFWQHQDSEINTSITGTSLYKLHEKYIVKNTSNSIIVAVLDSQIDLNHQDLKNQIWINKKEIPFNNIDDDKNGFIDDINGWNFVGKPNGGYFRYWNFECVRIIKKWDNHFKGKNSVNDDSLEYFNEYNRAKTIYEAESKLYKSWLKSLEYNVKNRPKVEDTLRYFFPKEDYTISQLDSLYNKYKINDKRYKQRRDDNDQDLGALIDYMRVSMETGDRKFEDLIEHKNQKDSILNKNFNIEINDRDLIRDNPEVLEKGYGNNKLNNNLYQLTHSTEVSSIIGGQRNKIGVNGFHNNIKIMPLCISVSGDEYDKDIAMAIYYAVNNGAKVINMSFGKEFSLNQKWVTDAFKYAEEHNVLLVHCSGNNNFNVDKNRYYPSDLDYFNKKKLVGNFINVGSISKRTDSTMVSPFSNYGKENVDIFAPGEEIYVAKPNNQYGYDSGTSLAGPMVSGTAALIWLYFPNLTVHEIKNIILESGVTIDKMVVKPGTKDEMVPFSELCKTGKVLNTYNAFLLAKKISKQKK